MDRYSRRNLEDLVVPNYQETSDSYPSPDMWGTGWNMNSSETVAEKCFDYDVINNGFSGGLYSQMEMGTSEQVEEETKRLKASGCFDRSLHDFDEIQQMDDMFFYSPTTLSNNLNVYVLTPKRFQYIVADVVDLLLWRNRTGAVILLVSSIGFWFLFERAGYNLLSFVSNVLLLLVAILFLWAKSATVLNRPLPPVPNMEIPEEFAIKAADDLRVWINYVLSIASDITIARNPIRLLQVSFVLWAISYVGTLINSLTLVYIGVLLSLSFPIVYENYQDHIDDKLNSTSKFVRSVSRKFPMPVNKEKKHQ